MNIRPIAQIFKAPQPAEAAGFKVARPFPSRPVSDSAADPFLLFDARGPMPTDDDMPGAPWHPHRGFDTVTYMKHGRGAHHDSMGNAGIMVSGEVQWMRAGRGIIHDECTPFNDSERRQTTSAKDDVFQVFQIWVNLPAKHKMDAPSYAHLTQETLQWREFAAEGNTGVRVKLISGTLGSGAAAIASPLDTLLVPVLYGDFEVGAGGRCLLPIPDELATTFVYVYHGQLEAHSNTAGVAGTPVRAGEMCVFHRGSTGAVRLSVAGGGGEAHFLLLAGKPIGEPIARRGPFVMNTDAEVMQAFADYRDGTLATTKGLERKF